MLPWGEKGAGFYAAIFMMSWTIGRLFGIPVRLHFTMVLVPFLTYDLMSVHSPAGILLWLLLVVLLFGSVLLHELGHALTARQFGISTQDIVLTPIGGIARVTRMPQNPKQEIAIAAAGPLVSLTLAGVGFSLLWLLPFLPLVPAVAFDVMTIFFGTNLVLAIFNLIPALPMDGGRVLRGILALKRDHLTATRIAARIGRGLAVLGGFYALVGGHLNLGLIALFIYITAGSEVRMAELRAAQEQMRGRGGSPFGFPFGPPRGWTYTRTSRPGGAEPDEIFNDSPGGSDWSPSPERSDKDVVVISGKAEIISRKDPKKKA
jgi:Zn-dependent protease